MIAKHDPKNELASLKLDKAKKWNVKVVNGCWLAELYLGNIYALANNAMSRPTTVHEAKNADLIARYSNLAVTNHMAYDPNLVAEFMQPWRELIKLPVSVIKEFQAATTTTTTTEASQQPLKVLNSDTTPTAMRYMRPISPRSHSDCMVQESKVAKKWANRNYFLLRRTENLSRSYIIFGGSRKKFFCHGRCWDVCSSVRLFFRSKLGVNFTSPLFRG